MELDAIVGAVVELGDRLGVPLPSTRTVYACAKLLDENRRRSTLHNQALHH
jgi:ketopantoate reductase